MADLLHMVPVGAAWFHWDSEEIGHQILETLTQDTSNIIIVGEDGVGKTSLTFQAAVTYATDNKQVTYIRPKQLSHLPLPVHGMPTPEPSTLQFVKFWYPEGVEEIVKWCGHVHSETVVPDVIIIDDFDLLAGHNKNAEHGAARLCASLLDAGAWIKEKSGACSLILTASHRNAALPCVMRQFLFGIVNLTRSCDQVMICQMTSATPAYSVCIRYTLSPPDIRLRSVDFRQTVAK